MTSAPQVSLVVLTLNEERNISDCLTNIFNQKTKYTYEVIVIDSSSSDKTLEIVEDFPVRIKKIRRKEFHHGGTRNLGANLSKGEFLVYIAGDAYPQQRNWLDQLIDPLVDNQGTCAVYGKQIPKEDCNPINRFRLSWNYQHERLLKDRDSLGTFGHRNYFFSTVNCSIRRKSWSIIKFREDIPIFEDTAFAKELIDMGYSILYNPSASVVHSHNLGIIDLFKRYKAMGFVQAKLHFLENLGKSFSGEGMKYLFSGIKYLKKDYAIYWTFYFLVQTFFGYLGLSYGRFLVKIGKKL